MSTTVARRFLLLAAFALPAALLPAAGQTDSDVEAQRKLASRVDQVLAPWDSTVTPGCSLSVMKDGAIIYKRGYGMADLEHDIPNTPRTVFHVASVSKQFTAAAIALLAQDGKLSLDDSVHKYVPELPDFGVPITIRQLIHHTSGLRDQWELLELAGWRYSFDLISDDDVMKVVTRQKDLNFPPNSQYSYSNTGYTLLAQIVARVSGQTFREFTRQRIFAPLGMHDTHFRDDFTEIVPRMAYGYVKKDDVFKTSVTNFNTVGATSLLTTAEDLLRWDENFYAPRVGGAAFIQQMLERGVLSDGKKIDYAFALIHGDYRGARIVSHGGSDAGYRAQLLRFPDQHFSVACLCNEGSISPTKLAYQIADIYLADRLQPVPDEVAGGKPKRLAERQLRAHVGTFLEDNGGSVLRLEMKDGKLHAHESDDVSHELIPLGAGRFRAKNERIQAEFRGDSQQQLIMKFDGNEPETYDRVTPYEPTAQQLAAFTGTYESEEVDMLYRIKLDDGALVISSLKQRPLRLRAVTQDIFETELGNLYFRRDAAGAVTGYGLHTGRIKNFRFSRSTRP